MQPMIEPAEWQTFVKEACNDDKYPKPLDLTPVLRAHKGNKRPLACVEGVSSVSSSSDSNSMDSDSDFI